MDIIKAMEIVNRKSSIPNDNETFEDIENAYETVMSMCNKALRIDKILSDIEDIQDICGWDLATVQQCLRIIHRHID